MTSATLKIEKRLNILINKEFLQTNTKTMTDTKEAEAEQEEGGPK